METTNLPGHSRSTPRLEQGAGRWPKAAAQAQTRRCHFVAHAAVRDIDDLRYICTNGTFFIVNRPL